MSDNDRMMKVKKQMPESAYSSSGQLSSIYEYIIINLKNRIKTLTEIKAKTKPNSPQSHSINGIELDLNLM